MRRRWKTMYYTEITFVRCTKRWWYSPTFLRLCVCVSVSVWNYYRFTVIFVSLLRARALSFFFALCSPSVTCTCNSRFNLFHPIGLGAREPSTFCFSPFPFSLSLSLARCFSVLVVLSLANDHTTQQILRFKCNVFLLHARYLATNTTLKLKLLCSLTLPLSSLTCLPLLLFYYLV